jgi:hypothetical protein
MISKILNKFKGLKRRKGEDKNTIRTMHIYNNTSSMCQQKCSSMSFFTRPSIEVLERKSLKMDAVTVLKKKKNK